MPSTSLVAKTSKKTETTTDEVEAKTKDSAALLAETDALMAQIDELIGADKVTALQEILPVLDKPYTLADAIREGSMVTDQKIGGWADKAKGETCALSAALLAVKARGLA